MSPEVKSYSEYILSLDLGSNSVGYAAIQTQGWDTLEDPSKFGVFLTGSHIFEEAGEDDKGKRTLKNQDRRRYRLGRRTYRRRVYRREELYKIFSQLGALPSDESQRDAVLTRHTHEGRNVQPWVLRARALDEALSLEEFAKAICHLNRHRGYLSTRDLMADKIPAEFRQKSQYAEEVDEEAEEDGEKLGVVLGGIKASYSAIASGQARTYGELMMKIASDGKYTRHYTKRFDKSQKDKTPEPETKKLVYRSDRALIRAEFHRIFDKQSNYHPAQLTQELRKQLEHIIFNQKELTGSEDKRKPCPAYEASLCAPKTSDAFQRSRIVLELFNNFTVGDKPKNSKLAVKTTLLRHTFSADQLSRLLPDLMDGIDLTVEEIISRAGADQGEITLNKRSGPKKFEKVYGHQTRRLLRELTEGAYANWNDETKSKVQDIINSAAWPSDAYTALIKLDIAEPSVCAKIALGPFPAGYGGYSTKFLNKISERMIETGEYEAIAKEELFKPIIEERLKRIRAADVNVLPDEESRTSLIKLPKDLGLRNPIVERGIRRAVWVLNQIIYRYGLPEKIRVELPRDLTMSAKNKYDLEVEIEKNRKGREAAIVRLKGNGIPVTDKNIRKARLWEESGGMLLYEGKNAPFSALEELEIDHAYPRSRLYINENRNLVLCEKSTNAAKGDQLLWNFLGEDFAKFETRVKQCKNMRSGKKRWLCETKVPDEQWLASQLAATGYIARELSKILVQLGVKVEVTPGKATALLRYHWGLENLFPAWDSYAEHLKSGGAEVDFSPSPKKKDRSDCRHHAIDALVVALTDVRTYQLISQAHKNLKPNESLKWGETCPIPNLRKYMIQHLDDIVVTRYTIKKVTGELHKQTPQREDLKKLDEALRTGEPRSTKVATGKLIRYDRDGKAAQVYPLKNNHHLTVYRGLEPNKKGAFEFKAEVTSLIEVAQRAKKKEPIYQHSGELASRGFAKWMTLEGGDIVEFLDLPGAFYRVRGLSLGAAFDAEFQLITSATMNKALRGKSYKDQQPLVRLQSVSKLGAIARKVQLNAFGEVIHEVNPHENPQFH
jgi:CRISPR-associated endonuclease Csn1